MISIDVNPQVGVLTLNIDAPLASANMRELSDRADAAVNRADGVRGMVIKAPQFPPWRDLSALFDKLRSLQAHRNALGRIAVVTGSSPMEFAAQLAGYFPAAEIDRFSPQRLERADAWVQGQSAPEGDAVVLQADEAPDLDAEAEVESREAGVVELESTSGEAGEEDDWFV
ncbi:MAG: STAS/SEC14 domain-containing protein [Alphaproteobacteria bacterium]|nr:STAS/SEC14 domain-containing protein [Alphaproteobacteria bacterium]